VGKAGALTGRRGVALWLFKQEPTAYTFADLRRDGRTVWDGVGNALALKHLRAVRAGDLAFFYHTGKDKAVVGEMRVVSGPREGATPGSVVVEVEPLRELPRPVPLGEIKGDKLLVDWELVRLPRLSVLPVSEAQWRRVGEMAAAPV
jgi:predicted RNA-binding protein with PUA-like domain